MTDKTILVKMGGSVITYKNREKSPKIDVIYELLATIRSSISSGSRVALAVGGGGYGHSVAAKHGLGHYGAVTEENMAGIALTHVAMMELAALVSSRAAQLGMPLFPVSPSSLGIAKHGKIIEGSAQAALAAMDNGFTLLMYGDIMHGPDKTYSIVSADDVLEFLCKHTTSPQVIHVSNVDGVYDSNPRSGGAKLFTHVDRSNFELAASAAGGSTKSDRTGGMGAMLNTLWSISKTYGSKCYIVNGNSPDRLAALLRGEKGVLCTEIDANSANV